MWESGAIRRRRTGHNRTCATLHARFLFAHASCGPTHAQGSEGRPIAGVARVACVSFVVFVVELDAIVHTVLTL